MDGSIRQILDPRILGASYSQTSISDATPFVDAFWQGNIEAIQDETYRSLYDPADTVPAKSNIPGAEAKRIAVGAALERTFNAFYTFNEIALPGNVLTALRNPNVYELQVKGREEVTRIMNKFRRRHLRFKDVVLAKLLTTGKVYLGSDGQILESSSGAVQTVDAGVPSGNQGSVGGIVGAYWSTAGTNIFSQLDQIRDLAASLTVPLPTDIWINAVNFTSLRDNTGSSLVTYFSRNADLNNVVVRRNGSGNIVSYDLADINGFNWHFIASYYTSSSGAATPSIPKTGAGSVVMTPPPEGNWFARANGRTLVPNSLDAVADVDAALAELVYQDGPFFFAKLGHNPVQLSAFAGDKFFAGFNEPSAVFQLTAF